MNAPALNAHELATCSDHLIVVVGPSGAGKDSVLRGWLATLPPDQAPLRARRVITRPAHDVNEDHEAMTEPAFEQLRAEGGFAFDWRAHGLRYGIRWGALAPLRDGRWVVMNGSREHLPQLLSQAPQAHVIEVTASPQVLAARLAARGREQGPALQERLQRHVGEPPVELRVLNDGALEAAVEAVSAWWRGRALRDGR